MNWDTVKGKWNELKADVSSKWAKLTDDDLALVESKFDALVGRLQQRYGYTVDQAEKEIDAFVKSVKTKPDKAQ